MNNHHKFYKIIKAHNSIACTYNVPKKYKYAAFTLDLIERKYFSILREPSFISKKFRIESFLNLK